MLLPTESPYVDIEQGDDYVTAVFGVERLPFLRRDVTLLALRNVTVEELAHWFVAQLTATADFTQLPVDALELRVSSGPGQWASSKWRPR